MIDFLEVAKPPEAAPKSRTTVVKGTRPLLHFLLIRVGAEERVDIDETLFSRAMDKVLQV